MTKILVTGAKGQLGQCIQAIATEYPKMEFKFTDFDELDITDAIAVNAFFEAHQFEYCVNCAAYTAVDKAEDEEDLCFKINAEGVKNLAEACHFFGCTLFHISTDFVFDGTKPRPYVEEDVPNPLNVYGRSKLKGENHVRDILKNYFIIRTSWVYSEYGHNFVKTMLRLGRERDSIAVVKDQTGSPTYAGDLASFILQIIENKEKAYGLYNYSNEGTTTWFEFASEIFRKSGIAVKVSPISSAEYLTPAKRPENSTLNKTKVTKTFQIQIRTWSDSLKRCLVQMKSVPKD